MYVLAPVWVSAPAPPVCWISAEAGLSTSRVTGTVTVPRLAPSWLRATLTVPAWIPDVAVEKLSVRVELSSSPGSSVRAAPVNPVTAPVAPTIVAVPSRIVLKLADASSGEMMLFDHAARSMV